MISPSIFFDQQNLALIATKGDPLLKPLVDDPRNLGHREDIEGRLAILPA
jgi:hypothetical protein